MKQARLSALHPFLFAAYPVLMLLAYNVEQVKISAALRSLAFSLFGAAALLLLFRLLLRDWNRAAFTSSMALILFFSYGHVYNYLETTPLFGISAGRHRLLLPIWIALFGVGLGWARRKGRDLQPVNQALAAIAGVALIFPLAQLILFGTRSLDTPIAGQALAKDLSKVQVSEGQTAPDIYYLLLDGYSRDDMLQKHYQLDNEPFLDQLTRMGFYVARCSQSNYAQTQLSLASSLNFNYLDALDPRYASGSTSRVGLPELIKHSAARQALESLGYKMIAFETGYEATQLEDADLYLSASTIQGVNDFENLLIRTTAGRVLAEGVAFLNLRPDWEARDQAHRERVLYTLEQLSRIPEAPGPKFVFAHIVIPHWPHVFGPNGEPVHEHPDSVSGYRDQVIFINKQILPILEKILAHSQTPPVLIIQGDHGAIIESPQRRMSILNTYYLPGGGNQVLYEEISPVNSFRVIFNHYFGASLPLLEDTSYYSRYETPYEYQIVPNERPGCE